MTAQVGSGLDGNLPFDEPLTNDEVAARLDETAELLAAQAASADRIDAYHRAATAVRGLDRPLAGIAERRGVEGLMAIPGIAPTLARHVVHLLHTGRMGLLERLRGDAHPADLYTTVPGLGLGLARRIHETLHIESLHELEHAVHNGRLETVPGIGPTRVRAVREALSGRFRRAPQPGQKPAAIDPHTYPSVEEILDVDREYRRKAKADRLLKIAPKHFNPLGEAWLPILHTERGDRHYTAIYSNTAHAHARHMTHDWVVVYRDDRGSRGRWTVVTSRFPPLKGRRIVMGRENECREHYLGHV